MDANDLAKQCGFRGRVCPLCERVVTSGTVLRLPKGGYSSLDGTACCKRCAAAITTLAATKCPGWINQELRTRDRTKGPCWLTPAWPLCERCGRDPLWEILKMRGGILIGGSACRKCAAYVAGGVRLESLIKANGFEAFQCPRCGEAYVTSRRAREYQVLWTAQLSLLHQLQRQQASCPDPPS